jgi:hypothetical protein
MPDPVWGGADERSATGLADMVREVEGVFEERQRRLRHETTESSRTDHKSGFPDNLATIQTCGQPAPAGNATTILLQQLPKVASIGPLGPELH